MSDQQSTGVRAQPETLRGRSLSASLTVDDLAESLTWYRDIVGFTVIQQFEREGRPAGAVLVAGDVRILLNQDDGAKGLDRPKGQGFSLQLTTVQNIDDVAGRIRERGGKLDSEPADMPWGVRAFRLQDPNGINWVISSPRPSDPPSA